MCCLLILLYFATSVISTISFNHIFYITFAQVKFKLQLAQSDFKFRMQLVHPCVLKFLLQHHPPYHIQYLVCSEGDHRILSKIYTKVTRCHNDGIGLNSGLLVSFASGVVERYCWMKQQSNRHIQGLSKLLFGCSAWGTDPNSAQQVWYVGIQ